MNLNLFLKIKNGLGHGHQLQMHEMSFNIHNEKGKNIYIYNIKYKI